MMICYNDTIPKEILDDGQYEEYFYDNFLFVERRDHGNVIKVDDKGRLEIDYELDDDNEDSWIKCTCCSERFDDWSDVLDHIKEMLEPVEDDEE